MGASLEGRETLEGLKRFIYVSILLLALAASLTGLVVNEISGIGSPFTRGVLILVGLFEVSAILLILTGRLPLRVIEEAIYVVPAASLLSVLCFALYLPATPAQAQSALVGVYLWMPAVYTVVFIIYEGRGAFVRAGLVYLLAVGLALPAVFTQERPLQTLHSTMLEHFFIANGVFMVLIFFVVRLKDQLRQTRTAADRMRRLAQIDQLTGLYNRRYSEETLEREMERCRGSGLPLTLILFDLDDFKSLNDGHGHDAGDAALVEISSLCRRGLRDGDHLGRWGGEEFVIIAPDTDRRQALDLADRLRRTIQERDTGRDGLSASFGVTRLRPEDSGTTLVKRADIALYRAKRSGKNRVKLEDSGPGAADTMPRIHPGEGAATPGASGSEKPDQPRPGR